VASVDVHNIASVKDAFRTTRPDVVVNAIGIVKQLPAGRDPVLSIEVNALFPHLLEDICRSAGARLIQVSTDCVFSGGRGRYTEEDIPDPVDLYGRTKLLGEVTGSTIALTIRTSIIGRELGTQHGLVEWFLGQAGSEVEGYSRVVFSGLSTIRLGEVISNIIESHPDLHGLWHVSSLAISKYEVLGLLNEAFATGTTIRRNSRIRSDRSLDSTRFWRKIQLSQPSWPSMIEELRADPTPYPSLRSLIGAANQSA
jgi:dTDP-4-dehydrorhamnose reductase